MNVAKGEIVKVRKGGKRVLLEEIEKFDGFTGYVFVDSMRENIPSSSYLFFDNDKLVAVIYEHEKDYFGEEALKYVVEDSELKNSVVEIHKFEDFDILLEYVPESRVEIFVEELVRMLMSIREKQKISEEELKKLKLFELERKERKKKLREKGFDELFSEEAESKALALESEEKRDEFQEKLKEILQEEVKETEFDEEEDASLKKALAEVLNEKAEVPIKRRVRFEKEEEEEEEVDPFAKIAPEEMLKLREGLFKRLNIKDLKIKKRSKA